MKHLADNKFIRLTTFRRSGEPVHTVVWHVLVDGALFVHTGDQTGKAKRLRANGRAEIAPSGPRGRIAGEAVEATGTPLDVEDPRLAAAFRAKYGFQYRAVGLTAGLRRKRIGVSTFFRFETVPDNA